MFRNRKEKQQLKNDIIASIPKYNNLFARILPMHEETKKLL